MQQQGSRLTLNGAKVEREKLLRLMLLPFNNTHSSHLPLGYKTEMYLYILITLKRYRGLLSQNTIHNIDALKSL
jgi:hypothetical protein